MGETVACANQKGGVGKTTTVVNLAAYLALVGRSVLVVDLDPQGNATSGLGVDRAAVAQSTYDALTDDVAVDQLLVDTAIPGLRLLPSAMALAGAEVELASMSQRERRLGRALGGIHASFDHILIDCPPSLGLLTVNGLTAADQVLIPLQCEYYALEGLNQLIATINLIRDHLNPALTIKGVLLTMYDARTKLAADVAAEARRYLGDRVFAASIPRSVRLSEAPSYGQPIALYRADSAGAEAYRAVAEEYLRRSGVATPGPASFIEAGGQAPYATESRGAA
ncbi:MAG TPA: AAA family ATPase [Candidatus Sulfotelmatobacter sp.]|nr:AAA family ATPase [Candidatus Sulfotelmatobacter sp.]